MFGFNKRKKPINKKGSNKPAGKSTAGSPNKKSTQKKASVPAPSSSSKPIPPKPKVPPPETRPVEAPKAPEKPAARPVVAEPSQPSKPVIGNMRDSTREEYRNIARTFYAREIGEGVTPSMRVIRKALLSCQENHRSNYWRKLKLAVAFDQEEKGYKETADTLRALKNERKDPKPKIARKKRINAGEMARVNNAVEAKVVAGKRDYEVRAAVVLARRLGCRPAEMPNITVEDDGTVSIQSAKVGDDRGIEERRIKVPDAVVGEVKAAAAVLSGKRMKPIQKRFARIMDKEFSDYKVKPTLYTFRHQKASDLKASGMSREQCSYVMGHQGTMAIEAYGNRRFSGGGPEMEPSADADLSVVRENHTPPPWEAAPAMPQMEAETAPSMEGALDALFEEEDVQMSDDDLAEMMLGSASGESMSYTPEPAREPAPAPAPAPSPRRARAMDDELDDGGFTPSFARAKGKGPQAR